LSAQDFPNDHLREVSMTVLRLLAFILAIASGCIDPAAA
jgi:hypothetical protein